jgi:C1A family cysteine protease
MQMEETNFKFVPLSTLLKNKVSTLGRSGPTPNFLGRFNFTESGLQTEHQLLPDHFDLKAQIPKIYDQLSLNSCVSNAACLVLTIKQKNKEFEPSRRYLYYSARKREQTQTNKNSTDQNQTNNNTNNANSASEPIIPLRDDGTYIDPTLRHLEQEGVCNEQLCPYEVALVNDIPSEKCDPDANGHKISGIFDLNENEPAKQILKIRQTLFYQHTPILLAMAVYSSTFDQATVARTGYIPMPKCAAYYESDDPQDRFLGGHQMTIIGYDHVNRYFICANSWSERWGEKGYCYLPYDFVTNKFHTLDLCSFYHVIEKNQEPQIITVVS